MSSVEFRNFWMIVRLGGVTSRMLTVKVVPFRFPAGSETVRLTAKFPGSVKMNVAFPPYSTSLKLIVVAAAADTTATSANRSPRTTSGRLRRRQFADIHNPPAKRPQRLRFGKRLWPPNPTGDPGEA